MSSIILQKFKKNCKSYIPGHSRGTQQRAGGGGYGRKPGPGVGLPTTEQFKRRFSSS